MRRGKRPVGQMKIEVLGWGCGIVGVAGNREDEKLKYVDEQLYGVL